MTHIYIYIYIILHNGLYMYIYPKQPQALFLIKLAQWLGIRVLLVGSVVETSWVHKGWQGRSSPSIGEWSSHL